MKVEVRIMSNVPMQSPIMNGRLEGGPSKTGDWHASQEKTTEVHQGGMPRLQTP
jgi:hypothetical protein